MSHGRRSLLDEAGVLFTHAENFMIAELITPLLIATAPQPIQATEQISYCHDKQQAMVVVGKGEKIELAQYRPMTFNGTQTYDWNGRPNDSDND